MFNLKDYRVRGEGEPSVQKVPKPGDGKKGGKGMSKKRVNQAINNAFKNLVEVQLPKIIKDKIEPMVKPPKEEVVTPPPPIPGVSPEVSAQLHALRQQNEVLQGQLRGITEENKTEKARAEKAEREGAIDAALNGYTFTSPAAREAARKLISIEVKRTEDGKLIAGENLPLEDFVKDSLTKTHDYFLAPADAAGAGAGKGIVRKQTGVGIETIRKDMSEAERQAVAGEIGRAIAASQVTY